MLSRIKSALPLVAALTALMTFASCGYLRSIFTTPKQASATPRPFPHAKHLIPEDAPEEVKGARLTCKNCHSGILANKPDKTMPASKKACTKCHEESLKALAYYFGEDGKPKPWGTLSKQSDEIIFWHEPHLAKKLECTQCHVGIDKNEGLVAAGMRLSMDQCMGCHQRKAPGKRDCADCHKEIDKDRPPKSHETMWKRQHGQVARYGGSGSAADDCSLCHTNDACITCHQTQRPEDHNTSWKFKPHGITAGTDRSRCLNCHTSDYCVRCHSQTSPRSHTAGWNAPRLLHCVNCHLPLGAQVDCFVCHKTTPGHDFAPPKPAGHSSTWICRSCHGGSMPHPDNGDDCNLCHH